MTTLDYMIEAGDKLGNLWWLVCIPAAFLWWLWKLYLKENLTFAESLNKYQDEVKKMPKFYYFRSPNIFSDIVI